MLQSTDFPLSSPVMSNGMCTSRGLVLRPDNIVASETNPVRAILRSIYRLMQDPAITDSLRNLVDSDLPKSVKIILQESKKFGCRVTGLGKVSQRAVAC